MWNVTRLLAGPTTIVTPKIHTILERSRDDALLSTATPAAFVPASVLYFGITCQ